MIAFEKVFVQNKNVRNFNVTMAALKQESDRGRFVAVSGKAGFGKTTAADHWHVANPSVFIRMRKVWRTSELPFLQELCRELGIDRPPHRKDAAFMAAVDALMAERRPVFVDEVDKYRPAQSIMFLEILRDLTDLTGAPVVAIGEQGLPTLMRRSDRVASRTVRHLAFEPVDLAAIVAYARAATGGAVSLTPETAKVFLCASCGDMRIIERDVENLTSLLNARNDGAAVNADLAKMAVKQGLSV